jgi:hypothetical protein
LKGGSGLICVDWHPGVVTSAQNLPAKIKVEDDWKGEESQGGRFHTFEQWFRGFQGRNVLNVSESAGRELTQCSRFLYAQKVNGILESEPELAESKVNENAGICINAPFLSKHCYIHGHFCL